MSECKHPRIQTFRFLDTGEPAGLWGCVECNAKFEPRVNQFAAVAAERERCAALVAAMDNDYLRTSPCRKALARAAKAIRAAT